MSSLKAGPRSLAVRCSPGVWSRRAGRASAQRLSDVRAYYSRGQHPPPHACHLQRQGPPQRRACETQLQEPLLARPLVREQKHKYELALEDRC